MFYVELYKIINSDGSIAIGPNLPDGEFYGWRLGAEPGKILTFQGEPTAYVIDVESQEGWDEIEDNT